MTTAERRVLWVDTARGIGILLVVFGHAVAGLIDGGLTRDANATDEKIHIALALLNFLIYTFHMPLFFFLSGLFLDRFRNKDIVGVLFSLGSSIAWPYFLWATIQIIVSHLAGRLANNPSDDPVAEILLLPVHGPGQFWFLHSLFFIQLISIVLLRLMSAWVLLCTAAGACALSALFHIHGNVERGVEMWVWVAVGACFAAPPHTMNGAIRTFCGDIALLRLVTLSVVLAVLHVHALDLSVIYKDSSAIAWTAWESRNLAATLSFGALTLAVSVTLERHRAMRRRIADALAWIGQRSMSVFLLHVIALAGTRTILVKYVGVNEPLTLLVILVPVGVALPLAVVELARSLSVSRRVGFGV